ncbi:MAG: hypothetical protein A2252_00215 [Elusimicrobia bacterium RIFOXYA2_FULL_39_19]|nr:MAG: hypothetical protein A2252_00215 [Elusimicrobia bacterium RIFOXYA2_FULL_39_19]
MDQNNQKDNEDLFLIKEALEGNRDSFGLLVDKYKNSLFNLVYKYMGNSSDAQDICQDTFIKAYTHLNEYKINYKFSTWLFTIAANLSKNKLKRRKFIFFSIDKPIHTDEENIIAEPEDKTSNNDTFMLKLEQAGLVTEMLQSLPADYKIPFLLRHEENRSLEEIAQITNLSVGVVKIRIHRARMRLLKKYKEKL